MSSRETIRLGTHDRLGPPGWAGCVRALPLGCGDLGRFTAPEGVVGSTMKMLVTWDERMVFTAAAAGCATKMDAKAPIGQGTALTPKELVVAGLCGCTAMDVMALMRKHKQAVTTFEVKAEVSTSEGGPPVVFTSAELEFAFAGQVDPALALEAVRLSQTRFCGVTAMLVKAFPIRYRVLVNGAPAGEGQADFGSPG